MQDLCRSPNDINSAVRDTNPCFHTFSLLTPFLPVNASVQLQQVRPVPRRVRGGRYDGRPPRKRIQHIHDAGVYFAAFDSCHDDEDNVNLNSYRRVSLRMGRVNMLRFPKRIYLFNVFCSKQFSWYSTPAPQLFPLYPSWSPLANGVFVPPKSQHGAKMTKRLVKMIMEDPGITSIKP